MLKIVKCQYCGKEFIETEEDYGEYIRECVLHEIEHVHIKKCFEENLKNALRILDRKYNTVSNNENYNIDAISTGYDNNDINYIAYNFTLIINKDIYKDIELWGGHREFKHCPTIQEIINEIEKYYKSNIKKTYEGVVTFEDWMGGNGANDYVLDGQYTRDIFKELLGKKIKITVVDD
ncbi:hypothetical protein [Clostridium haemolyticum]|uniref:Uncharacterized protein n=1 Tax=Clostridium haemolyticum NCTC 9693 TaxID=1443114 RepID=A0ABR4TAX8_CLOHA|nr:hypothetical protein [Clostridium haemolyticum]KEI14086.1 hypothetical protein Z960_p0091 [Clostridium haemolyticum NCTC 9693]